MDLDKHMILAVTTQNAICSINLGAFSKSYDKAMYLLNHSNAVRSITSAEFSFNNPEYKYLVDNNIALEIENVFSIILYCDFDILSYYFKTTFKKQCLNESYRQLLIRMDQNSEWFRNYSFKYKIKYILSWLKFNIF